MTWVLESTSGSVSLPNPLYQVESDPQPPQPLPENENNVPFATVESKAPPLQSFGDENIVPSPAHRDTVGGRALLPPIYPSPAHAGTIDDQPLLPPHTTLPEMPSDAGLLTEQEFSNLREMLPFNINEGRTPSPEPQAEASNAGNTTAHVEFDYDLRRLERELEEIVIHRQDLQTSMDFIRLIREATLENSSLDVEVIKRLRNPSPSSPLQSDLNYTGLLVSLHMFLATLNASQAVYNELVTRFSMCFPHRDTFSLYRITKQVTTLAGTATMIHDMCPDSCVAFTGPFSDLDKCPMPQCGKSRWDPIQLKKGKKVPAKTFSTIALGPQIQALFGNTAAAQEMQYRQQKTHEIIRNARELDGALSVDIFDDIYSGSEYLHLYQNGVVNDDSILFLFSIDGAQLYEHKASYCWIYVWVILDLDPTLRYKKRYVLPGCFIPGPKKPKNLDSFLFPGLHHVSALQNERLKVWDASKNSVVSKTPVIALKTADAPAMALISGEVGHSGAKGCHKYCDVPTRLKPGGSHYYPVLLRPVGLSSSDFPDIKLSEYTPYFSQKRYDENLQKLLATRTTAEFEDQRRESGLSKPSIFSGLPIQVFGVPGGFPVDTMHLISLNITDLLLSLWRGTMKCDPDYDKSTWDWVVLTGKVWNVKS